MGKNLSTPTALFTGVVLVLAAPTLDAQEPLHAQRAMIILQDNSRFEVRDLVFASEAVNFLRTGGERTSVDPRDVAAIRVHRGTRAMQYGLIGAAIGIGSGAWAVVRTNAVVQNSNGAFGDGEDVSYGPWVAGFGLGFGMLGAAIGSFTDIWEGVYANTGALPSLQLNHATKSLDIAFTLRWGTF